MTAKMSLWYKSFNYFHVCRLHGLANARQGKIVEYVFKGNCVLLPERKRNLRAVKGAGRGCKKGVRKKKRKFERWCVLRLEEQVVTFVCV